MAYEKQTWVDGVTPLDAEHLNHMEQGIFNANGNSGEDGGYYTPEVTQPADDTMEVAFTPSKATMPEVASKKVTLPAGAVGKSAYAYAVEGGYTGTEAEFAAKLAKEKFANPYALTFTGAATGSYDGSEALTVEIPNGGGGSSETWTLLADITTVEEVNEINISDIDFSKYKHLVAVCVLYGSEENTSTAALRGGFLPESLPITSSVYKNGAIPAGSTNGRIVRFDFIRNPKPMMIFWYRTGNYVTPIIDQGCYLERDYSPEVTISKFALRVDTGKFGIGITIKIWGCS